MTKLTFHTGKFFEVTTKAQESKEDGSSGLVKHVNTYEAVSFSDAEARALEAVVGDTEVTNITIAAYREVVTSDDAEADKFYKAKLAFITVDEASGKEKRSTSLYLVQARSLADALRHVDTMMKDAMIEYDGISVVGTLVEDCYFA